MAGSITSTGLGSGLDIENLVSQLVTAEGRPTRQRLDRNEAELQARISAYGALKGAFSSFQTSLNSLTSVSGFQSKSASSSDKEVATVTSSNAAAAGSYDLEVFELAKAQRLVSDPAAGADFTALDEVVGTGSLSFSFGTVGYDDNTDSVTGFTQDPDKAVRTVDITDGSLTGIRDAVNAADIGVKASIVFDGTNYRLGFAAEDTGAANAMQISVSDDDGNATDAAGLSRLNFNETTNFMVQNQAAQDASATLNGVAISSASNTLDEAVEGLSFNLLAAGTTSVTVESDPGAITKNVEAFVKGYNQLSSTMKQLSAYDPETGRAGILNGDASLRGLESRLNRVLGTPLEGADSNYQILAQIGITRNARDGSLELDKGELEAAIQDNPEAVTGLFAAFGQAADAQVGYLGASEDTRPGDYAVDITQLATRGQLSGAQAANLTITAGSNDTLNMKVDGISASITLAAGTYTAAELAAQIQSRLNGSQDFQDNDVAVQVSESGGVLSLTSERYGSASRVEVTGGNAATGLFGATPASTDGLDVAGTIGGVAATGSGRTLTGSGDAAGLKLEITGGSTGDRGTVNFTRGFADQLNTLVTGLLDDDNGMFDPLTESLRERLSRIEDERQDLTRRLENLEERYRAEFNAMDRILGQLQGTSDFLTRQLETIPVIGQNNRNR
ncbi:flagellar filament capping protein FliD [Thiohalobacter thiocyanaticus]|uniref:Flagellar hook-associated protein 2 n=1 Tax=Thiohalobacter thiocyanaticus TaxID=585455 RepID=A0A426QGS4_9GAMM|nr:flagellar filament capping protein FliD [Thiohalobacter thiocyanaticus]RRQ20930.1 flagellar hook protein FliD [Thiohalobacter thiocyanaticus]